MNIKTNELYGHTGHMVDSFESADFIEKTKQIAVENKICTFVYDTANLKEICTHEALEGKCDLHRIVYSRHIMGFEINTENLNALTGYARDNGGSALLKVSSEGIHGAKLQLSSSLERSDSEQSVILAKLVKTSDGDEVLFLFNTVISPLVTTVKTLNTILVFVSVLLILLAVIFSVLIAFFISKPISDINRSAKELAKGNYGVQFEGGGFSEVVELGNTLNYASQELSKVDKLKTELISNISHDLRTPITLISGYAQMMRDIPEEMSQDNLQIIIDESERMESLVNDVLDISKLQSGNAIFNMKPLELTSSIENEIARYRKLRAPEGYTIDFEYTDRATVLGDVTRLMQVLYNLMNNAVTHGGEDKRVLVVQSIYGKKVKISVKDYGGGISPRDLSLIWDRYYKVDKSRKRSSKGSGLGLSIVKSIIEAHKGSCGVESSIGHGSVFWFELDLLDPDKQ